MNNLGEVVHAVFIGFIVADFLINTGRVLKAIELCKECLFILDNNERMREYELYTLLYKDIYSSMLKTNYHINYYTNAIKHARKILRILRKCGERTEECKLIINLTTLYLRQSTWKEKNYLRRHY